MKISKAVITAAGPGQNTLPLQRLVDRDGIEKSALELIIEEVVEAGIEQIGIVIREGDQAAYTSAAGALVDRLQFLVQKQPRGYGDAILCSEKFAAQENVLHLVGDHIFLSYSSRRCAQQLLDVARAEGVVSQRFSQLARLCCRTSVLSQVSDYPITTICSKSKSSWKNQRQLKQSNT